MTLKRICLLLLLLLPVISSVGCETDSGNADAVILYSADDDPIAEHMAETLKSYLEKMGVESVDVIEISANLTALELEDYINEYGFLINPQNFYSQAIGIEEINTIPEEGYLLRSILVNDKLSLVVAGRDKLGLQYGIYELLYLHGVRFFHPEEEWIPETFDPRYDINTTEGPAFELRTYGLHTTHPLELNTPLSDSEVEWSYAQNWLDWIVKMRANRGKGAVRGVASEERYRERADQINEYNELLGFHKGTGMNLHETQQGGVPDVNCDTTSYDPAEIAICEQEIRDEIEARLEGRDDLETFGIGFGPTEFTTTPCDLTLHYINYIGKYVADRYPGVQPTIGSHITGNESCGPEFDDLDYRDLGVLTDPRIAISFHTVMYYDLVGPAPCYNREDFSKKLELMQQEAPHRDIIYHPEGAYWLSFDNDVPVFLPITIYNRWYDIQILKPLLNEGLMGHKMFTTGHEWGYWMQDYLVGKLHWNPDLHWVEIMEEWTDLMGEAGDVVLDVLVDMALYQYDTLTLYERADGGKGLMRYMAGEDMLDELGQFIGYYGHDMKIPFSSIMDMDDTQIGQFIDIDMAGIMAMAQQYDDYLLQLALVEADVTQEAASWFREIYDGTEINGLRARHIYELYMAVINYRDYVNTSNPDSLVAAWEAMDAAEEITEQALEVIAGRESDYRYPLEWGITGGITPETEEENGTTYRYRVWTKTHLAFYWTRRNIQARNILEGTDLFTSGFYVEPVIDDPGTLLNLHYPNVEGVTASIDYGDTNSGDENDTTHDYGAGTGCWELVADIVTPGYPDVHYTSAVGRVEQKYSTDGTFNLITPDDDLVETVLSALFPTFYMGLSPTASCVVVAEDANGDDAADGITSKVLPLTVWDGANMEAGPADISAYLALPAGDVIYFEVPGRNYSISSGVAGGVLTSPITMTGELRIDSIIEILVATGSFGESDARNFLADLLGYTPETLPEYLPFEVELGIIQL